jgi:formate hydrogenlyase subunit 3/multisubunit Na+/H+ antiporter MnhD subunit
LGSGLAIMSTENPTLKFPWPSMGNSTIGIDGLSAFFLVPVFLIGGLGSLYGLGYWHKTDIHRIQKSCFCSGD